MSRVLVTIFIAFCAAFATPPQFASSHTFELKKDEWARVFITEKSTQKQDSFDFRWTLFDNTNLTLQSFFRYYPRHFVLALDYGRNRAQQDVLPDFTMPPSDITKIYITFLKFENKKATLRVDLLDPSARVDVMYIDPPKRQ